MNQAAAESTGRGRTRWEEVHYGLIFFFFPSKGDEAVGERGQKGRLRAGQRFASSVLITALWVLDSSPIYKGEGCASERVYWPKFNQQVRGRIRI